MNNNGLSILEVLVAMIVLSIGLLGVAPMVVLSTNSNSISRDTTVASKLAREKIEYYEALDSLPSVPFELSERTDDTYDVNISIHNSSTNVNVPEGLYEINVTVNWQDKTNSSRSTSYSTYLRKGAIHEFN